MCLSIRSSYSWKKNLWNAGRLRIKIIHFASQNVVHKFRIFLHRVICDSSFLALFWRVIYVVNFSVAALLAGELCMALCVVDRQTYGRFMETKSCGLRTRLLLYSGAKFSGSAARPWSSLGTTTASHIDPSNIFVQYFHAASETVFLPRDAMQARPMSTCGVCLSVCLCVCHVREFCQKE